MELEDLPLDILKIILEHKQNLEDRIAHVKRTFRLNREFFCVYGPEDLWWWNWFGLKEINVTINKNQWCSV